VSIVRTDTCSFVAQFFNAFLLGSTGGDVIKALYAARETHHKKTEAVVTVFVDRLLGLWAMLLFAALMMIPNAALLWRREQLGAPALLILLMLRGASAVLGVAFWGGLSKRFPRARHWLRKFPKGDYLERASVSPEWPLVKAQRITGTSFPVTAAMGDFHEAIARLVEQRVGFGPVFDRSRLVAVGSAANQVPGQVAQQVFP